MLKIEKITDKMEVMDVKGQGCSDDCAKWLSKNAKTSGCVVKFSPEITTLW